MRVTVEYVEEEGTLEPRRATFIVPAHDETGRWLPDELAQAITEVYNPLMIQVSEHCYVLHLEATRSGFEVRVSARPEECPAIIRAAEEKLRELAKQALFAAAVCRACTKET